MKHVDIVIGANYGDEGKGQQVHRLIKDSNTLIVRYSGGAQAAHTVVHGDEMTVFRHLGAGSHYGCPTLFAKEFILNPVHFLEELDNFQKDLKIYVDPMCRITTPVDVYLNQAKEYARGSMNHGSCGMGIYETELRDNEISFKWCNFVSGTKKESVELYKKIVQRGIELLDCSDEYEDDGQFMKLLQYELENPGEFIEICDLMRQKTRCVFSYMVLSRHEHVIFEGSQGLMLDEDYGVYPYLTPGSVGLSTPSRMIETHSPDSISVHWVTRPYLTRHGAGPLPKEVSQDYLGVFNKIETNKLNKFQGRFRYGILDVRDLCQRVEKDFCLHSNGMRMEHHIVITCSEHLVDGVVPVIDFSGNEVEHTVEELKMLISEDFPCEIAPNLFNDPVKECVNHARELGVIP